MTDLKKSSVQKKFDSVRDLYAWQRNHLANERTFLAWIRTAIAFIALGIVLEKLADEDIARDPGLLRLNPIISSRVGMVIFGLGVLIIMLSIWRFVSYHRQINMAGEEFTPLPDIVLAIIILAVVAASLVFGIGYFS